MIQRIIKVIQRAVYYVCFVGMVVLLLMMLLTVSDIIGRFMRRPIIGTFEITQYMLVIVVLLGIGYAQQVRQNIRVELFSGKMPPLVQIVLYSLFTFVALVFFSVMVWQGWELAWFSAQTLQASDYWDIPLYPFKFLIPFGCLLLSVELLLTLIASIASVKSLRERIAEKEVAPLVGF